VEASKPKARRCAVYTRKSSEEGLEQNVVSGLHGSEDGCFRNEEGQTPEDAPAPSARLSAASSSPWASFV
jgi:hypothetical protein